MNEEWKYIEGFGNAYEVSNYGNVRSYKSLNGIGPLKKTPHLLMKHLGKERGKEYYRVKLRLDGKVKMKQISRLVAIAFIPNPDNKPCVDHIDRNTLNNHISNLRWATFQENQYNTKPSNSKTGIKGVTECVYKNIHYWRACWKEDGKRKARFFKTFEEALTCRNEKLALHYNQEFYIT